MESKKTIKKWIISKDRCSAYLKFSPKLVYVYIDDYNDETKTSIKYFQIGRYIKAPIYSKYIKKDWLYEYEEAKIKCKEFQIKVDFKNKNRDSDGYWRCSCCKKTILDIEDCTIDHIKPKSYFKDKKGEYFDEDAWKRCWSEDNLSITCVSCNRTKANLPPDVNDELNEKAYKQKKRLNKMHSKNKNKPAYGLSSKEDDLVLLAKRDSNYIDVDLFFKKKKRKNKKKKKKNKK